MEMNKRKLTIIKKWPISTLIKEVQSFLKFINFY